MEKAILKAVSNGMYTTDEDDPLSFYHSLDNWAEVLGTYVFSHDLAKALWGDDGRVAVIGVDYRSWPTVWEYHLQQMVISEDPVKYLGEHI